MLSIASFNSILALVQAIAEYMRGLGDDEPEWSFFNEKYILVFQAVTVSRNKTVQMK